MIYLKEWVRGLVLLLLLAACLEMLLPMSGMKKYVRMTMGMFLLLGVLNPILALFGRPIVTEGLLQSPQTAVGVMTLKEVLDRGAAFQEQNHLLVTGEVEVQLADQAKAAAQSVAGVAQAAATVKLANSEGKYRVKQVNVTVLPGVPAEAASIRPVDPVRGFGGELTEPPAATDAGGGSTAAADPLGEAVRKEVAVQLGLGSDSGLVRVVVQRRSKTAGGTYGD